MDKQSEGETSRAIDIQGNCAMANKPVCLFFTLQ
jgi:hypothetical protein